MRLGLYYLRGEEFVCLFFLLKNVVLIFLKKKVCLEIMSVWEFELLQYYIFNLNLKLQETSHSKIFYFYFFYVIQLTRLITSYTVLYKFTIIYKGLIIQICPSI